MSQTPMPPTPSDDRLDRAEAALKHWPTPKDGPSPDLVARTLAALAAAKNVADPSPLPPARPRRHTMLTLGKLAAAILAAVAGLFYVLGTDPQVIAEASTFTKTAAKLRDARTLRYRFHQSMRVNGLPVEMTNRLTFREPDRMRQETFVAGSDAPAAITIIDTTSFDMLVLSPATKVATRIRNEPGQTKPPSAIPMTQFLDSLRQLADRSTQPAGEREIEGVKAQGFLVQQAGQTLTIWIDPSRNLPLRVESEGSSMGMPFRATFDAFEVDPKLDDSLFNLDPPAGYTLQQFQTPLLLTPEEAVATVLRAYAEATDGGFPRHLDRMEELTTAFEHRARQSPTPPAGNGKVVPGMDPGTLRLATAAGHLAAFLAAAEKGSYGYRPEGARSGQADRIVFWNRVTGTDTYRAVFADFHIADVRADQLPPPRPEPAP
jgi:outer membrane lipoprotein-sorting protein